MHCFIIRDKDNQQQDIADLSRDTDNAHQALDDNFDKDKIKDQLDIQKEAVALGTQAMDAYKQSKLNEAKADIRAQMAANGELDGLTEAQINKKIVDSAQYQNVDKEYGVGSDFWTNGSAATGLLAGVLGGNVTGGIAAGAAPYMAALVKDSTDNPAARAALHAIVSGALASAQGANPGAAAAGGFVASASADALAMAFYGTTADKLVGDEKTMISNLVVLLGAAAGAAAGGDGQALASGGNAARVEVENNALNSKNVLDMHQELAEAERTGGDKLAIYEKYAEIAEENRKAAIAESCSGDPFCANGALAEAQAGKDIVNSLNRLSMFSDLSSEDLAQLTRFVLAENDESASAIYQALPDYVKVALHSKEAAETLGLGAAVGGKGLAALGVISKKAPANDPSKRIASGQTVGDFEKSLVGLPPGERVAIVKQTAAQVALEQGMVKDNRLTKMNNGRDVYRGSDGNLYAIDTQHGRFEVVSPRGKHLGEVDFSFQFYQNKQDKSGGHDLKVK